MFEVLGCVARDLEGSLNVKPPAAALVSHFSVVALCNSCFPKYIGNGNETQAAVTNSEGVKFSMRKRIMVTFT